MNQVGVDKQRFSEWLTLTSRNAALAILKVSMSGAERSTPAGLKSDTVYRKTLVARDKRSGMRTALFLNATVLVIHSTISNSLVRL